MFVKLCLHTNKRRPCSSTLSGHPSSSFRFQNQLNFLIYQKLDSKADPNNKFKTLILKTHFFAFEINWISFYSASCSIPRCSCCQTQTILITEAASKSASPPAGSPGHGSTDGYNVPWPSCLLWANAWVGKLPSSTFMLYKVILTLSADKILVFDLWYESYWAVLPCGSAFSVLCCTRWLLRTSFTMYGLKVIDLSLSAFQGVYVPAGTPPTQTVPMPVIPQQPDVILRQEMAVAPGAN